jgi:curved DNA-binding protein CbpA
MNHKYFEGCTSLDEVKSLYKQLAMLHHPDRGGDTATMQKINLEYESIMKNPLFKFWKKKEETKQDFREFPDIINKIIGFTDITIELCGNWIWLSGATFKYKNLLKGFGFFYAGEKKLWYWRPHDYKSANRKPLEMSQIRSKYGSDIYQRMAKKALTENEVK